MSKDVSFTPELIKSIVPTGQASVRRALRSVSNPVAKLRHLRQLVAVLVKQLSRKSATFPLGASDRVSAADRELDRGIEADEVRDSLLVLCARMFGLVVVVCVCIFRRALQCRRRATLAAGRICSSRGGVGGGVFVCALGEAHW